METLHLCPLSPIKLQDSKWELSDLLIMEEHIATQTNCQHPQLKTWVLSAPLEGSTPLMMACSNSNLDSVKRIVENWQVNVNATGVFYFLPLRYAEDYEKALNATPLHVAAFRCHYEIVHYLVGKGADIFAKTSEQSVSYLAGLTPLYGCISIPRMPISTRQQGEVVRFLLETAGSHSTAPALLTSKSLKLAIPIWRLHGLGPEATITLIKYGMNLKERSRFGTILIQWVSKSLCYNDGSHEGSLLELVQLIVEKEVDLLSSPDSLGYTPLFLSAAPGTRSIRRLNFSVFDFLLEREEISRLDKINALELAGAVILSFSSDVTQVPLAFSYWRRAYHLRYLVGADPIPKKPILFKQAPKRVEWTTLSHLEEIENDPSQHKIASLLVHLRMLSVSDDWHSYSYLCESPVGLVLHHHKEGLHQGFAETVDSFLLVLEFILPCDPRQPFPWTDTVKITEKLVVLLKENPQRCTSELLQTSAELITAADPSLLPNAAAGKHVSILSYLKILLRFVSVLVDHPDKMNNGIMDSLTQLVRHDRRTEDRLNLLLVASTMVRDGDTDLTPTIHLLLQAQANPNAFDLRFRSPLHILANLNSGNQERINQLGNLLLENGAHPYMVDYEGRTAADIWLLVRNQGPQQENHRVLDRNDLPDWCLEDVQELKCYSATIVRRFHIPYVDEVPATLYPFMNKH